MDWFCICTSGETVDGRFIEPEWLRQAAATYSPETYGARINIEHFYGLWPQSELSGYGDVVAVKIEEKDGVVKLYAQLDPTEKLIKLNKLREKVYTSIELALDFCKTGKAYLVGLAVTDMPASTGTSMLQFSKMAAKASESKIFITNIEENPDMNAALQALFSLFTKAESSAEITPPAVLPVPSTPVETGGGEGAFNQAQLVKVQELIAASSQAIGNEAASVIKAMAKGYDEKLSALEEKFAGQTLELNKLREGMAKIPNSETREEHGGEVAHKIDY